jgi:hypothetical protein
MHTQQTVPSQTHDHPTFLTMVRAFGADEPLACVECGATATRLFYLHTLTGNFIWGAALCEEHHEQACQEANARLTHKVRVIHSLREASDN